MQTPAEYNSSLPRGGSQPHDSATAAVQPKQRPTQVGPDLILVAPVLRSNALIRGSAAGRIPLTV